MYRNDPDAGPDAKKRDGFFTRHDFVLAAGCQLGSKLRYRWTSLVTTQRACCRWQRGSGHREACATEATLTRYRRQLVRERDLTRTHRTTRLVCRCWEVALIDLLASARAGRVQVYLIEHNPGLIIDDGDINQRFRGSRVVAHADIHADLGL